MTLKSIFRTCVLSTFFALGAQSVSAQDLLARQAPIDRRMKAVDTLVMRSITEREITMGNPAADLYEGWDNRYAHRATKLPDTYKIDLRGFHMPTPSRVITSNFGPRWGRTHKGLDIKVYIGDTIRAAFSGKVRIVRFEANGYGNYVVIRHNNGLETIYGHMSKHLVRENQDVRAGDPIGLGGNTGRSTGSHLHFETRLCGVALNPALMFDFRNQDVTGDYYVYNRNTYERESAEATRLRGKTGGSYTPADVGSTAARAAYTAQQQQQQTRATQVNAAVNKQYHKVGRGETLSSIARKRGVTVDKLCKLNRISKSTRIRPGMILRYS